VIIARLASALAAHPGLGGVTQFGLEFLGVFWMWNAFTYYSERFESEGFDSRVFTFLALLPVAALAIWAQDGLGANYVGFAVAYLVARAINIATWLRAGWREPLFRPVALRFAGGFAVVALVIGASLAVPVWALPLLWAVAVLIDIATPYFTLTQQALLPPLSSSKFPDRFGLLTLIVLGESVTGVITSLAALHETGQLGVRAGAEGVLGLAIGFGLWWIYYDFIARRPPRPAIGTALGWVYLHLAALATITMTGAGLSVAITESAGGTLPTPARYLLVSAIVLALLALGGLEMTLTRGPDEPTHPRLSPALKLAVAALLAVLGALDLGWNTPALLATPLAALAVQIGYGAYVWFTAKPPEPAAPGPLANLAGPGCEPTTPTPDVERVEQPRGAAGGPSSWSISPVSQQER